jgi:hypothetical protein
MNEPEEEEEEESRQNVGGKARKQETTRNIYMYIWDNINIDHRDSELGGKAGLI